jgi:hypothetical protein
MSFEAVNVLAALESGDAIPIIAISGGLLVALIGIIGATIRGTLGTRAREQTKRELAAYIAEGTMRPEDAERILTSDARAGKKCC